MLPDNELRLHLHDGHLDLIVEAFRIARLKFIEAY